ncbi:STAS domain-containing protein [Candidatus Peregrinibacteria bacterium]|nr:STAS domain-containing protein [Candidatus Peregrinibacteria bacterium]
MKKNTPQSRSIGERIGNYLKNDFKHDLLAGTVVALIALPLAIAFAVASGARPEQGLYTSIIAGVIMGALSGSKFQISGPTGAFIVILLGVVNQFGLDGLMTAGFMAGVLLLAMGLTGLGSVIKYIPYPVTVGFTAGIGTIIFIGQIKDVLGLKFPHRPEGVIQNFQFIFDSLSHGFNLSSALIALVTIVAFIGWKKKFKSIPPAPAALVAGLFTSLIITNLTQFFPAPPLVGNIPAGLPALQIPDFSWAKIQMLIPSAFTIAMLGAIESLLSAVVADGMTGTKHNSNKELISQGVGNLILPFFGGIPATGAIARTAANIRNGGRTQMSAIIHGVVLLIIVLLAAPLAAFIPMAALAGILVMVAVNMAEIPHFIRLLKAPKEDAFVMVLTYLLTVFVDLTVAVGLGIVMAALLFIKRVSQLNVNRVFDESLRQTSEGSKRLHASLEDYPEIRMYELAGPLFFGAASQLESQIEHDHGQALILRMKHVHSIDATAVHALEMVIEKALHEKQGKVYLATLRPEVEKVLEQTGLIKKIGGKHYCPESATKAIELAKAELKLK